MSIISIFYYLLIIILFVGFSFLLGYSIFDINYKFSISYGMTPHSPELSEDEIPSKRVVLFLLDGSTSDTFFKALNMGKTPYLREILEKRGVYGYARTVAPTESIPCLTAISTGHYQDGSLALKQLSNQRVLFDTIYNESNHAWGLGNFGCYFQKSSRNMDCLPRIDNGRGDIIGNNNFRICDTLVDYLQKAKYDKLGIRYNNLIKNKISFLLHLDETDDLSHHYGPSSDVMINYHIEQNLYYEKVEKAFYDFYQDNKTTFIITSDHGMNSNPQYHGDDTPACKNNPFVAWGAGIRKPIYREKKPPGEEIPSSWGMDNYVMTDISQIDITPLISGLLGINFPIHSLGVIPIDILDVSDKVKSKILFGNMMELMENYKIKIANQSKSIVYIPYKPLKDYDKKIDDILNDINNENYAEAIDKTKLLINHTLEGINYIYTYDRFYLKTIVTLGYIFMMLFLFIFVEMRNNNCLDNIFFNFKEKSANIFSLIITLLFGIFLFLRLSPLFYYLYTLVPCYLFWKILANIKYLKSFFIKDDNIKSISKNIFIFIFIIGLFFLMVSKSN